VEIRVLAGELKNEGNYALLSSKRKAITSHLFFANVAGEI
jgi:hypothetical protein